MGKMACGGVESTVMNHYRHIDRSRVQFDFIVDSDSTSIPQQEIEALGGRIFLVPPYKHLHSYIKECTHIFAEIKPHIVHAHLNALSVFPLYAAKRAGIPVRIAHSHSTSNPDEPLRNIMKNTLKHFAHAYPTEFAACSDHAARWLFGDALVDDGGVHIINNALEIDDFAFSDNTRASTRDSLGIQPDQPVIGCVGRMSSQKNQLFAEDIFAQVLNSRPDALLVFAGDGPLMGKVQAHAKELGIVPSVRFLGIRNDIVQLYQAFDVLLFPSLYEGLGMAAIEAQTADLPVLASTEVPAETRIVHDLIQYLPLDDGPAVWAEKLLSLIMRANSRSGKTRINRGEQIAMQGYDIHESAAKLCQWYCELASLEQGVPRSAVLKSTEGHEHGSE
jgi:glycosyltransferase involved in cell wall biosynthesis